MRTCSPGSRPSARASTPLHGGMPVNMGGAAERKGKGKGEGKRGKQQTANLPMTIGGVRASDVRT
eukprot:3068837-Alexandrium_andersonii.AAC.1